MSALRTGPYLPDILTSALLFLLIGPPLGGVVLMCWYVLQSSEAVSLRAIWPVPLLSYFVGGPAAFLTGVFTGWRFGQLHRFATLAWIALIGAASSFLAWWSMGFGNPSADDLVLASPNTLMGVAVYTQDMEVAAAGAIAATTCALLLRHWIRPRQRAIDAKCDNNAAGSPL